MKRESAHVLGLQVLGWMAGRQEVIEGFLAQSGATAAQLRAEAQNPAMLRAVLDHVMLNDAWVLDCAAALGEPPEALGMARAVLGGGDRMNWT